MSLYQTIRAALQDRAALAAGFPDANHRAYEGMVFNPAPGAVYARMTLIPASGRPFSVSGDRKQHVGTFQVDIFGPPRFGTGAVEALADAVKAQFEPSVRIPKNGEEILIDWAERNGLIIADPQWLQCPVSIRWRCFSASN